MANNMPDGGSTSKVYINPNFNRKHNDQKDKNTSMHINPNFNRQIHLNTAIKPVSNPKIYVNPNFIRPKTNILSTLLKEQTTYRVDNLDVNNEINFHCRVENEETTTTPVTRTRYHIVRKNKTRIQTVDSKIGTNNIKVSKYKIVSLDTERKKINSFNQLASISTLPVGELTPKTKKVIVKVSPYQNRFKFTKKNIASPSVAIKFNSTLVRRKKEIRSTPKNKVMIKNLKKNNIPCPQFRKYGKCLRKIQGNCEFLHDIKHVSICRRFLKGVCHNSNCLLSHDLTDKKMPTCYFYLNGMCTKEGCPYLHIKLNEQAKICIDFLKGYCEKGEQCLNRHMNICPDLSIKGVCFKKNCPYPHKKLLKRDEKSKNKSMSVNFKIKKKYINKKIQNIKTEDKLPDSNVEPDKVHSDSRYYTVEPMTESGENELVLKPSRCKLGTLPSFIQL